MTRLSINLCLGIISLLLLFTSSDAKPHARQEPLVAVVAEREIAGLRQHLNTSWRLVDPTSATRSDLEVAKVVVPFFGSNASALYDMLDHAPAGQLLQLPMTGFDWLDFSLVPLRFAVCNTHSSAVAISEYVIAAVLSWNVHLPALDAGLRHCTWRQGPNDCMRPTIHQQSKGQTIGIIGYGSLGAAVAQRASALGMRVVAVTSPAPNQPPPPLSWVGNDTMLPRLMQESDFVVITCPLLPSTRGLVDANTIRHMKRTGVLINVARGPIIDEAAVYDALLKKRIGGAVLDVWWNEKAMYSNNSGTTAWPSRFNFSALPNVWMTPHASSYTDGTEEENARQMALNFDALANGKNLTNVVRPGNAGSDVHSIII
mmetsp:Transcript_100680/g.200027  ORF Transcript_100680/g.200027 Transcript_100680/m.200027 type:complete len:372 (+) Transcript_100680:45-1160(+)